MSSLEIAPECSGDQDYCEVLQGLCFMNGGDETVESVVSVKLGLISAACLRCKMAFTNDDQLPWD